MQETWIWSLRFGKSLWRREQLPTPVFFPGESRGQRSLAEPPSMGSQRVRHDWVTNTTFIHMLKWILYPETPEQLFLFQVASLLIGSCDDFLCWSLLAKWFSWVPLVAVNRLLYTSWREVGEDVKRTGEHQRRRDVHRACLLDLRSYQGRISWDFALSSSPP